MKEKRNKVSELSNTQSTVLFCDTFDMKVNSDELETNSFSVNTGHKNPLKLETV